MISRFNILQKFRRLTVKLSKVPSLFYMVVYLAFIPIFAGIFMFFPSHFYHSTIQFESPYTDIQGELRDSLFEAVTRTFMITNGLKPHKRSHSFVYRDSVVSFSKKWRRGIMVDKNSNWDKDIFADKNSITFSCNYSVRALELEKKDSLLTFQNSGVYIKPLELKISTGKRLQKINLSNRHYV